MKERPAGLRELARRRLGWKPGATAKPFNLDDLLAVYVDVPPGDADLAAATERPGTLLRRLPSKYPDYK